MARLSTLARFELSGEILSEDTIALLASPVCKLPTADMDAVEFATAWDLLSDEWQRIRQDIANFDTERLRKRWIIAVLDLLGHDPKYLRTHPTYSGDRTIPLTHRAGDIPMWFLDYNQDPDVKLQTGRRHNSPHELFQEYLDLTEDNWGIICNGRIIRLLHDYHKTLTRNYVEADLESIFDALDVDAFRAVWRIFRASSFAPQAKGVRAIDKLCEQSRQEGAEIGKELRKQVLEAIRILGNGFLAADKSGELRQALTVPEAPMLYYQALLRIVYRLLFLLYIENKTGWTPASNPVWASSYSITRLREQAEEATSTRAEGEDHWEGLKVIFGIIRDGSEFFSIHPYGGELFDDGKLWQLDNSCIKNSDLLTAIRLLTFFEDKKKKVSFRVNFRTIRIDALGSVYEALLDVAPTVSPDGVFTFAQGTERKLTGSYYTPPELVAELIKSALVPVIEQRVAEVCKVFGVTDVGEGQALQTSPTSKTPETFKTSLRNAILAIKVVDPACGSGAFLVQALDKLSEYLVRANYPDEEPKDEDIREARRDVVTHCIHGVDLNPMAVELCKFTLWLHVAHPKLPLSYLEPRIKCGNALIGVPLKKQVEVAKAKIDKERADAIQQRDPKAAAKLVYSGWPDNVPDEAFDPVTGDDKVVAKRIKERNKKEREQAAQTTLDDEWLRIGRLADLFGTISDMPEDTIERVRSKSAAYGEFVRSQAYEPAKAAADTWCAAFFWPLNEDNEIAPTTKQYRAVEKNPHHGDYNMMQTVRKLAAHSRYFHWEIEFPVVFSHGGFDCVLGNPPWEMLQLEEREFFASRAPRIASLAGDERKIAIAGLESTDSDLAEEYRTAQHTLNAANKLIHHGERFPLTAVGKLNTYALFAETSRAILAPLGRAGIIVPTGIATDENTSSFFGDMVIRGKIESFLAFKNERFLFPKPVEHDVKFGLLTMLGDRLKSSYMVFTWMNFTVEDMRGSARRVVISRDDMILMNPNTKTAPVFRTAADSELAKSLYRRVPVLCNEYPTCNPWDIQFRQGLFNMTSGSKLFHNTPTADSLPLYEGKFVWQYDHRFGSYASRTGERGFATLPDTAIADYQDPHFSIQPFYWVHRSAVEDSLNGLWDRKWILAYRSIQNVINERTGIFAVIPRIGVGNSLTVILPGCRDTVVAACLLANLNSLVFDYVLRQKMANPNVNSFILKQAATLPPKGYSRNCRAYTLRVNIKWYNSLRRNLFIM